MKIKCRIDSQNVKHTRFTVFQDGDNCGQLTMDTDASTLFFDILDCGMLDYFNFEFVLLPLPETLSKIGGQSHES